MDNFYNLYKTPCGNFAVIGTMDTTNLSYHPELDLWQFSIFIECKEYEADKTHSFWLDLSFENENYYFFNHSSIEKFCNLSEENVKYIIDNIGIIRNFIDSARYLILVSNKFKKNNELPNLSSHKYDDKLRRLYLSFEDIPFEIIINIIPGKGARNIYCFYSMISGKNNFYGCLLNTIPSFFIGSHQLDNLDELIRNSLKLKYFF